MKSKLNILVVEDNPVQIDWAKKQLCDCSVTIATNAESCEKLLEKIDFDILIFDLELPAKEGDIPSVETGINMFNSQFPKFKEGGKSKSSGLALVSNFEHHLVNYEKAEEFYSARDGLHKQSLNTAAVLTKTYEEDEMEDGSRFMLKKSDGGINNIVILCDWIHINDYPQYHRRGEVFSNNDVREKFSCSPYDFCKAGAIPLKPYKEVVEYLSQFVMK